jgi:hypothetical protein
VIYPDLGFTLSLLIKGHYSKQASILLRNLAHPLGLSLPHRLQIENGLLRRLCGPDPEKPAIAKDGLALWRYYLLEGIFLIQTFNLESAFAQAASWNAAYQLQPPPWGLLLHVAVAATAGATFLSYDPVLRKRAADEGLTFLPSKL